MMSGAATVALASTVTPRRYSFDENSEGFDDFSNRVESSWRDFTADQVMKDFEDFQDLFHTRYDPIDGTEFE